MSFLAHTKATVFVPGGASGMSFALARKLAAAGHEVLVTAGDKPEVDKLQSSYPDLNFMHGMVATDSGRLSLFKQVTHEYPQINVLIIDTGESEAAPPLLETTAKDWPIFSEEINRTLLARMHLITLFLPVLMKTSDAIVVNMTSTAAICPTDDSPIYSAALGKSVSFI